MLRVLTSGVNVTALVNAIELQPELWDENTFRTEHACSPHVDASDILVRFNKVTDIKTVFNDIECFWQDAAFKLPIMPLIYDLMMNVAGDQIGRVVITKLQPGGRITPHVDGGAPAKYYQRFHLSLKNAPGAYFRCGDSKIEPLPGTWFIVDNSKEHEVVNDSAMERWTLIVDVRTPLFEDLKETYSTESNFIPKASSYPEGISYQLESFTYCTPELKEFAPLHWAELGVTKDDVPVDVGWARYTELEQKGALHTMTVRDSGKLIGYHITFVTPHYHYDSTLHGMVDLYYVLPEYRKQKVGVQLFIEAEKSLRELGVVRIVTGTKVHLDNSKLFLALGYEHTDLQFVKVIQ